MKPSEAVRHPLVQRAAIVLYVVCIIGVISAYIGISTVETRQSLYFQGEKVLQAGAINAVRGAFIDARIGQFAHPSDFQFILVSPEESAENGTLVGQGKSGPGGFAHIGLNIPANQPAGTYDLVLKANNTELGAYETRQSVEVRSGLPASYKWPTKTERGDIQQLAKQQAEASRKQPDKNDVGVKDGVLIDVLPGDHEVVRGLPNAIYLRTRDSKTSRPISTRLKFLSLKGYLDGELPAELKTDRLGLVRLSLTPITDQVWQMEAETTDGKKSETEVKLTTVAAQFVVQPKKPVFKDESYIEGKVYSLFETGAFFVDLYAQDRRVAATALGLHREVSGLVLDTPVEPSESAEIYRLQIYGDFYNQANAWDSAYVVRGNDSSTEGLREAAIRVLGFVAKNTRTTDAYYSEILADQILETASTAELNRWLPAFLLAIPRQFGVSPPLFNTQHADRAELEQWKASVKSDLKILVGLVLLIGIVALFYFTFMGIQQVRARSRRIYESDVDDSGEGFLVNALEESSDVGLDSSRMDEISVAVQGGLLLLSIVLFAIGVWMLMGYL